LYYSFFYKKGQVSGEPASNSLAGRNSCQGLNGGCQIIYRASRTLCCVGTSFFELKFNYAPSSGLSTSPFRIAPTTRKSSSTAETSVRWTRKKTVVHWSKERATVIKVDAPNGQPLNRRTSRPAAPFPVVCGRR
jgi:hypothetical protein